MTNRAVELNLIEIFSSLNEIPFLYKDKSQALKRITEVGKQAMGSHACTLAFVDLENKWLTQEACAGFNEEFEKHMVGKKLQLGSSQDGDSLDYNVLAKGEVIEIYDLQRDGHGIINPKIAKKYNLKAALSYPLKSEGQLIGYFNYFSSKPDQFTEDKKS